MIHRLRKRGVSHNELVHGGTGGGRMSVVEG